MATLPYDATVVTVTGEETTLADLEGKALLVVNVASKCGLTPQYAQLEELQKEYGPRGLQVVGFPCNQFAGQEPGSDEEIAEFCSATYGVSFPVFSKIKVNGRGAHPIYQAIRKAKDSHGLGGPVLWNFEKFLVAPGGDVVARFRPKTLPDAPEVIAAIEGALPA